MSISLMSSSALMANPLFTPRVVAALATDCGFWAVSCVTLWKFGGAPRGDDANVAGRAQSRIAAQKKHSR